MSIFSAGILGFSLLRFKSGVRALLTLHIPKFPVFRPRPGPAPASTKRYTYSLLMFY